MALLKKRIKSLFCSVLFELYGSERLYCLIESRIKCYSNSTIVDESFYLYTISFFIFPHIFRFKNIYETRSVYLILYIISHFLPLAFAYILVIQTLYSVYIKRNNLCFYIKYLCVYFDFLSVQIFAYIKLNQNNLKQLYVYVCFLLPKREKKIVTKNTSNISYNLTKGVPTFIEITI